MSMLCATKIIQRETMVEPSIVDRVVLDADERHRRRIVMIGEGGTEFLLDLPEAVALRHGDGLVLEDGGVVLVAAKPEALVEITAVSPTELTRLAWHLGNRHTPVQVAVSSLRIRRDHVLEEMLQKLGAAVTPIEAPFDPESGAYGHADHAHEPDRHAPSHVDDGHSHDHHHHAHER